MTNRYHDLPGSSCPTCVFDHPALLVGRRTREGWEADPAPRGSPTAAAIVHLAGNSFCDAGGPFLGLGASYFLALRDAKDDPQQLNENLGLLASRGFNFVRIFTMVSWDGLEIAPVSFTNRAAASCQPCSDYWTHFRDLLLALGKHGMRAAITIFADAQFVMPAESVTAPPPGPTAGRTLLGSKAR
jgi:hypothetical protein